MRFNDPPSGARAARLRSEIFALVRPRVRCVHDADDIVQNVMLRVWFGDRLDPDRTPAERQEYLSRAILCELADQGRRTRRHRSDTTYARSAAVDDACFQLRIEADEQARAIHSSAATLPARLRDAFFDRLLRGLTIDQAADALGCNPATIKRRLSIARRIVAARCSTDPPFVSEAA